MIHSVNSNQLSYENRLEIISRSIAFNAGGYSYHEIETGTNITYWLIPKLWHPIFIFITLIKYFSPLEIEHLKHVLRKNIENYIQAYFGQKINNK